MAEPDTSFRLHGDQLSIVYHSLSQPVNTLVPPRRAWVASNRSSYLAYL